MNETLPRTCTKLQGANLGTQEVTDRWDASLYHFSTEEQDHGGWGIPTHASFRETHHNIAQTGRKSHHPTKIRTKLSCDQAQAHLSRFFPASQSRPRHSVQSGLSPSALPLTPSPTTISTLQNPRGVVHKSGSSQHSLVFQQLSKKKPVVEMVSSCVLLEGSLVAERGSGINGISEYTDTGRPDLRPRHQCLWRSLASGTEVDDWIGRGLGQYRDSSDGERMKLASSGRKVLGRWSGR